MTGPASRKKGVVFKPDSSSKYTNKPSFIDEGAHSTAVILSDIDDPTGYDREANLNFNLSRGPSKKVNRSRPKEPYFRVRA